MQSWQEQPQAQATCAKALSLMAGHGIAPTPVNFELWFFHALGQDADLRRALDAAVANGTANDLVRAKEIHTRFFVRSDEHVEEANAIVRRELVHLSSALANAGDSAAQFGTTLGETRDDMGRATTPQQFNQIVDRASDATDQMAERNKALENQVESSRREIVALKARMEAIRQESRVDSLTELANRRAFDERIGSAVRDAENERKPMCVLMCDIDHFKTFNDTWGHATGDQVLRLVASLTKANIKGKDLAARYGGEEIVVVLPETQLSDALKVAEHIRASIESKKIVKKSTGAPLGQITVSIGAAQYITGETQQSLIERADMHLYAAKLNGRNQVAWIKRGHMAEQKIVVGSDVVASGSGGRAPGQVDGGAKPKSGKSSPAHEIPALELEFVDQDSPLIVDAEIKLNDTRLLALFKWWNDLKANRPMPGWHDQHLDTVSFLREHLHLHEFDDGQDQLRVRFVGQALVQALGTDPTGYSYSASHSPLSNLLSTANRVFELARLTRSMKEPLRAYSKGVRNLNGSRYTSEILFLPFSGKGGDVEYLLGATLYTPVAR
jgi:diguanylate cyclase